MAPPSTSWTRRFVCRLCPEHEGLRENSVGLLGGVEGLLDVLRMAAERLLAEHVLARLERADRPFDMHGVRQRCRRPRPPGPRAAPRSCRAPARSLAPARRPPHDRRRGSPPRPRRRRGFLGARQELVVDVCGGEEAPPDRSVYPHDGSVTGLKAVSRMRWFRGRVSTKTTGHVVRGHHPGSGISRCAAAHGEVGGDSAGATRSCSARRSPKLMVERAREADLGELGRAVDGLERESATTGLGCEGDDVCGVALQQVRQRGADGVEGALDVDVDHLLELVGR